ncbi:uncharacterized protein V6R79_020592 [Siganus canaliculatus]
METQTENEKNNNGQLIFVPHKDTIRLLEVYVKRSLSLNDGTLGDKRLERNEKWVTMPRKLRRHSSDPSLHVTEESSDEEIGTFSAFDPPADLPPTIPEETEKAKKKSKKIKKPSFWKSFVGIFYRKSTEDEEEEEDNNSSWETPRVSQEHEVIWLPKTPTTSQKRQPRRRKSLKKRFSKRRLSITKFNKSGKEFSHPDITRVQAVSVEQTNLYYEKVSEELEKIVHEIQDTVEVERLSDEEAINRIIALTKEQGDAIDDKLKGNPTLNNFFQGMTYTSFQKLADAYLQKEASPTRNVPAVQTAAPELVKLALTYDFTAKIAKLSKQNVGHITGLGNRYLQDRFEYKQACTDQPLSDSDG